jgi:hypothetical protein
MAEIPFVTVPKMKVSDLIDIWVGGVGNINELSVGKVGKDPIGLPPLLCFGGFQCGERGVELSCVCGTYVILVNKMTILQFQ